ncbi:3013_t:CDS:1, partial [Racocetra persica]
SDKGKQKEVINKVQQKDKELQILSDKFIQLEQIAKIQSDKFQEQEQKRKNQIDYLTKLLYIKEKDKYKTAEIEDSIYNTIRYFRKESAKKSEKL